MVEHVCEWQSQHTWDRKMQLIREETAGQAAGSLQGAGMELGTGQLCVLGTLGPHGGSWASELEGRE